MRFMTTFLIEKNGVFPRYEKYSSLAASSSSTIHRKSNENKVRKEDMVSQDRQARPILVQPNLGLLRQAQPRPPRQQGKTNSLKATWEE